MSSITQSLAGARCLITGGSRGIGLAIAQQFSLAGGSCILVSRNEEALLKAKDTLHDNPEHLVMAGDVGSYTFWQEIAKHKVCTFSLEEFFLFIKKMRRKKFIIA